MSSLKAIFTGLKKTKLIICLALVSLAALAAKDYRAGFYVSGEKDNSVSLALSSMEAAGKELTVDEKIKSAEARASEKALYEIEKAKAEAARKEKEYEAKKTEEDESSWRVLPVEIEITEREEEFLRAGDEDAIEDIKRRNDLDELWLIERARREDLYECALSKDGEEKLLILTDGNPGAEDERRILELFLDEYRAEDFWLVEPKGNTEANILVDGEEAERIGRFLVLSTPEVHLRLEKDLYEPTEMDIDVENVDFIEYFLHPRNGGPLFVSTIPYTDSISYRGEKAVGGYVPETSLPFSVEVKKEGFEPLVISSSEMLDLLECELFPSTLHDEDRLLESRDRFYRDLLLTLSGFGLGVTATVLSNVYDVDIAGIESFAYGISIFQLIRTMDSLFEYKEAMRFGL